MKSLKRLTTTFAAIVLLLCVAASANAACSVGERELAINESVFITDQTKVDEIFYRLLNQGHDREDAMNMALVSEDSGWTLVCRLQVYVSGSSLLSGEPVLVVADSKRPSPVIMAAVSDADQPGSYFKQPREYSF